MADCPSMGNNLLRASNYRKLFPRQVDGSDVGVRINLDFAHLIALPQVGRRLRGALLLATANVGYSYPQRLRLLGRAIGSADGNDVLASGTGVKAAKTCGGRIVKMPITLSSIVCTITVRFQESY